MAKALVKEENFKEILLGMKLKQSEVNFVMTCGGAFIGRPEILARKLKIQVDQAKRILDLFILYKIPKKDIKRFENLVKNNLNVSLDNIALEHTIDRCVVLAYKESTKTSALTTKQKDIIKQHLDDEFSISEISELLRIDHSVIREYIDEKFITFSGNEGQRILEIINNQFGKCPVMKLRKMIINKDIKLQEQICCQLQSKSRRQYSELKQYFTKFEESKHFVDIDYTLTIKAKECIRNSSLFNLKELSEELNRMEVVIKDYLLSYFPDESLLLHEGEEQFDAIQSIGARLGKGEQISHTTYRMIISESVKDLIQNVKQLGNQPMLILNRLLPLAFYYIKCSLPLDEFTQIFAKLSNISLTTLDLFHLIFQMSDPIVRGLCIEHYSFSHPVPFYYPRIEAHSKTKKICKFEICSELWYSLQQFNGLVSFGLGWASWNPIGKSHLLDLMFETDFVKGSPRNSPFHFGSIDIQMTKNLFGEKEQKKYELTEWAYLDCHGNSDLRVITSMCRKLSILIIQITNSDFEERYELIQQDIKEITSNSQNVFLFIRDHPGYDVKSKQVSICGMPCSIIFIPNIVKNKNISTELKNIGYRILHSTLVNVRLANSDFLEEIFFNNENYNKFETEKESLENIMSYFRMKNWENGPSPLNYYPSYKQYMHCYYKSLNETNQKKIDELNNECGVLKNVLLKETNCSKIVLYFNEIISNENSTLILWKLAKELKAYAEEYTLEILWREALLSNKYFDSAKQDGKNAHGVALFQDQEFSSNFSNHVERGEPFELIDGDNLRYFNQDIDSLLFDLYEKQSDQIITNGKINWKKRPPIVISIFGPQSSGKSTLLNYCFGCKFLTSAGRCTKGVYASLSKLSQPINHSDHFLILDTEGLDSIEKGNNKSCIEFDRTMVLFCLAVSQVVIINLKGDIGEEMRNLLQICAYSLTKLKVSKVAAPKIFFVLNQQADPDPQKHLDSINTLLEDLKKGSDLIDDVSEGFAISDLIQVSREKLFVLPSAFNSFSVNTQLAKLFDSELNKLAPTISFANKCADLRMSIIKQLITDEVPENQASITTLSEWMEMSGVIWDTIVKYQDIVKYRNIDELRCSNLLRKIVNDLLKNDIYLFKDEYRRITENLIKEIEGITSCNSTDAKLDGIKEDLDEIFEKHQEEALLKFTQICQEEPLLIKMDYMCDDARSNLNRLIFMEKKIYEDKLRFQINAKMTEIKISENMMKLKIYIEKNADKYLDLTIEQQKTEFDDVWLQWFWNDNIKQEKAERAQMFDKLYSIFRIESKTIENKQVIYSLFRELNFDMDKIMQVLGEELLTKFCNTSNAFSGTEQFIYPWRENRVPLKDMKPFAGKTKCHYLSKESLFLPLEVRRNRHGKKRELKLQNWVPLECLSLIKYCSGYYSHPDITWDIPKRKQILLLASKLRDPDKFDRSTWEKFIYDLSRGIEDFIRKDPYVHHSTIKEIVTFLCHMCRVANHEINYIEAKLTNKAERTITTFAFALAFKSILDAQIPLLEKRKIENERMMENNLEYFLLKISNRKMARGNWERKEMRETDRTVANKFARDFLGAVWRNVNSTCASNIKDKYFDDKKDLLSHSSLLLLANDKVREELNKDYGNVSITDDNFVVQFFCNQSQKLKNLFQEEWMEITNDLHDLVVENMKEMFSIQISIIRNVLTELLTEIIANCNNLEHFEEIWFDSDSCFLTPNHTTIQESDESAHNSNPETRITREAPLKSMVLFLEMYLNPEITREEFNKFFNNDFYVDNVKMTKSHENYVLSEKPVNSTKMNPELFQKLIGTTMFSKHETIFNIKVYLANFLSTLTSYEFQVTESDYLSILKETKEHFEMRVINCPYKCPSCGKFCEREIHPHEGRCQVMTGHQISSMGGKVWKTDKDKTAVLFMCENYKDDMQVLIPGQNMRWSDFKETCGDQWDWSVPKDDKYVALQIENQEKMEKIWNKFGKAILQYYSNRGTHITYIPYTTFGDIFKSLYTFNSQVCFVIDGTNLMGNNIIYVKNWVSDIMRDFKDTSIFNIIVYHGHCRFENYVEKFPQNSVFTSDIESIEKFLGTVRTYSDEENEFAMLHGLATATTDIKWESGLGVKNTIIHFYVEPTKGYFSISRAYGKCIHGCSFDWYRDIIKKFRQYNIEYKRERYIKRSHPEYNSYTNATSCVTPSINLKAGCKPKYQVFIDYKPDN